MTTWCDAYLWDDLDDEEGEDDEYIGEFFASDLTRRVLAGYARPATRIPTPINPDRGLTTLPPIDDYQPSEVRP